MYEFVCTHIFHGCTHRERSDTPEAAGEKAIQHLHEHDGINDIDDDFETKLDDSIVYVRL